MAKSKGESNTFSIVVILLLSVAVFTLTSLYLEIRHKNELLVLEVERLEGTQVLLMVPDEQAEVVAKWMSDNPEATKAMLTQAKPQQEVKVSFGPDNEEQEQSPHQLDQIDKINQPIKKAEMPERIEANPESRVVESAVEVPIPINASVQSSEMQDVKAIKNDNNVTRKGYLEAQTVSENDQGVKVIVLPHGGIRVTTRELD